MRNTKPVRIRHGPWVEVGIAAQRLDLDRCELVDRIVSDWLEQHREEFEDESDDVDEELDADEEKDDEAKEDVDG